MPEIEHRQPSKSTLDPVCLVTGGSSGIGQAIALKFASHGYRIAICGRRQSPLESTADQIRQVWKTSLKTVEDHPDETCIAEVVDLGDTTQTTKFADSVFQQFGRVDVLVNNAAAATLAPFETITAEEFEQTLNINVRSVFYLTQKIWNRWKEVRNPQSASHLSPVKSIINVSSLAAVDPFPNFSIYGASKAWLDLMTHALAVEGESHGIRICSIRPGAVETPLLRGLFPEYPVDQCASPEDVAQLAWNCVAQPQSYPSGRAFRLPDTRSILDTEGDTV